MRSLDSNYFMWRMNKAIEPNPTHGEGEPEGEDAKKKPYGTKNDPGKPDTGHVEPSRNTGEGLSTVHMQNVDPHRYQGPEGGSKGNDYKNLGKALVQTPWGVQETNMLLTQDEASGQGFALVTNPQVGPVTIPVQFQKAKEGQDLAKSFPAPVQPPILPAILPSQAAALTKSLPDFMTNHTVSLATQNPHVTVPTGFQGAFENHQQNSLAGHAMRSPLPPPASPHQVMPTNMHNPSYVGQQTAHKIPENGFHYWDNAQEFVGVGGHAPAMMDMPWG